MTFYKDEDAFAWDRFNEDLEALAGILYDLFSCLDCEPTFKDPWERLTIRDQQRYWKIINALASFLDVQMVEGVKASKLDEKGIEKVVMTIREMVDDG